MWNSRGITALNHAAITLRGISVQLARREANSVTRDGRVTPVKHRRLGTQAQDRRNSNETTIEPKFEISTLENPGKFRRNRTTFDFVQFLGKAQLPQNPSFLVKKCSDRNFDAIFEISTLEHPHRHQISSKSDKLSISVIFWGTRGPRKKPKFSSQKSFDQNFHVIFGISTFERY